MIAQLRDGDKGGREGDGKGSREVREGRGSGDGRVEGALGLSLRRSWCIWEVHPALGQRQGLGLGQTQTQTGALFGFGHREDILSSQLLRALLCVRVSDRYARLGGEGQRGQSSGTQHLHTPHTSRLPLWGWAAQGHAFFEGVDWDLVDSGASPPALACFDRRLGCLELTQHDEADVLTDEQQELFAGF
ncbi:hypothetical protein B484DRAFT_204991 [Ochromonadaceae sp. CCMP2298]|nr:hypothetical protein B484DRAFT_204991 [Ochromonadaceae sp. CCMP2298]